MNSLIRIRSVFPLNSYHVRLEFTDGSIKEVNLEPYLHGPMFEEIRNNPDIFRSVRVDERTKTIVWQNGADIDPDVLFLGLKPAWMESSELVSH